MQKATQKVLKRPEDPRRRAKRKRDEPYNVYLTIRDGAPDRWWLSPDIALLDADGHVLPWKKPITPIPPGPHTARVTVWNMGLMSATNVVVRLYRRYIHFEEAFSQVGVQFATIPGGGSATVDFAVDLQIPGDSQSVKCFLIANCWHYLDKLDPANNLAANQDRRVAERWLSLRD